MEEVPRRTSLVPLAFPCFVHCLIGVETEGLLDYQGRAGIIFGQRLMGSFYMGSLHICMTNLSCVILVL